MWKLLPVCLLVSCAGFDQQQPASDGAPRNQGRIVRQVELPLQFSAQTVSGKSLTGTFRRTGIQGWLNETGAWQVKTEVHHGRLRCATYETGIQLGRGNPACADVEWLTGVEYASRLRHCNSAGRLHDAGGELAGLADFVAEVSCVRVVVRCEGAC